MRYLHTMIRVSNLEESLIFFQTLGLKEIRRRDSEKGRYTNVHLAAKDDIASAEAVRSPTLELTYNWDPEEYRGGRNFGHLAFEVEDIYAICKTLIEIGVVINRPPRDGHMAFVRTPDGVSIELLQKGESLPKQEPWASMQNSGEW
ncbi:MAG: VOC family protein [Pseudomonadota bacterium]|nr:VOC family protein [Pseudomonadota bacterium]